MPTILDLETTAAAIKKQDLRLLRSCLRFHEKEVEIFTRVKERAKPTRSKQAARLIEKHENWAKVIERCFVNFR